MYQHKHLSRSTENIDRRPNAQNGLAHLVPAEPLDEQDGLGLGPEILQNQDPVARLGRLHGPATQAAGHGKGRRRPLPQPVEGCLRVLALQSKQQSLEGEGRGHGSRGV